MSENHEPHNGSAVPDIESGAAHPAGETTHGEKHEGHHHHGLHDIHMPHDIHITHPHRKHRLPRGIHQDGESNRAGFHPWHFLRISFQSSCTASKYVNVLWPFVPVAIALHFTHRLDMPKLTFAFNYIAMVPTANLIGFAGQELARKLPKVFGVLLETFLGSIVEIILLMVLLAQAKTNPEQVTSYISVIRDAILGSILANLLLCLGACFFVGGMRQKTQHFDSAVSEVGGGLLLTAGVGLAVPRAFYSGVVDQLQLAATSEPSAKIEPLVLQVSRATSVLLLVAFITYVWFQMRSHHSLYDSVLEADEEKDLDRDRDLAKSKLTLTECFLALALGLTFVSMHAIFLVEDIIPVIDADNGTLSETFMGLILVPLVEKASEHLTAVDEAWDNQMNFALAHILGSTVQTALLNASLVVIVGWGLDVPMDLNFSTFQVILLILAIIVVGNFIRDQESNYLEGALCIIVYIMIAVATWYFPNRPEGEEGGGGGGESNGNLTEPSTEPIEHIVRMVLGG